MDNFEAAISGVALAARILNIETPGVQFFNDLELNENGINAVFVKERMIICFNKLWIESANFLEIQITCFHETRHVFQYLLVSGKYKGTENIDQQTINTWKQDLRYYEKPSGILGNNEDYLKQSIEIDAIAFAHYFMKKLYDVKTVIPSFISSEVIDILTLLDKKKSYSFEITHK